MKIWKTMLVVFISCMLVATMAACGKKTTATTTAITYAVKKGIISNTITAAGNLALSKTQDLPINLFYPNGTKGTVASVNVLLGDSVTAGEVLVSIDQSEWNDQLDNLVVTLTSAQRTLTQMQSNLISANQTLVSLIDTSSLTKAILNAKVSLQTAQANLVTAVSATDFNSAYATLQKAQTYYDYIKNVLRLQMTGTQLIDWQLALDNAQDRLTQAQTNYDNVLAGYDTNDVAQKKLQVQIAQMTLDAANAALTNNPQSVALQQIAVNLAQGKVLDAQKAVADAQKKLTLAQAMSPLILASFDGFVTAVNVKGGDQVLNGTVAVTIADPNKFQANIMVSEMNIVNVQVGGQATMSLNALSGVILPAVVAQIAPTATISSGVVNYSVTVNITSTRPVVNNAGSLSSASGRLPSGSANATGQTGAALQEAINSGTLPSGATNRSSSQVSTATAQNIQIKQGLSGTVTLIIAQANNALLVPNGAITKSGGQSIVNVVSGNNTITIEKRTIQTGLSDYQNTQVISGLNEGDKIQYSKTTASASKTTTAVPSGGGMFIGR